MIYTLRLFPLWTPPYQTSAEQITTESSKQMVKSTHLQISLMMIIKPKEQTNKYFSRFKHVGLMTMKFIYLAIKHRELMMSSLFLKVKIKLNKYQGK